MSISIFALRLNSEDEHVSGQDVYQERRNSVQQVRAAPPVTSKTPGYHLSPVMPFTTLNTLLDVDMYVSGEEKQCAASASIVRTNLT